TCARLVARQEDKSGAGETGIISDHWQGRVGDYLRTYFLRGYVTFYKFAVDKCNL
ncbi:hypothetical protein J6590_054741, partial [Homalodisca vitripennis]